MINYSEELFEMASVRSKSQFNYLLSVNPDLKRDGEPYFKMYNSKSFDSATLVWRISFLEPKLIKEHKGKIKAATKISTEDKKNLIKYLQSKAKENPKFTVWDALKFHWNDEMGFCQNENFEEYMNGNCDLNKERLYLNSKLSIPDYENL